MIQLGYNYQQINRGVEWVQLGNQVVRSCAAVCTADLRHLRRISLKECHGDVKMMMSNDLLHE